MRDYIGCIGLLALAFWLITGGSGCAATPKPAPIASDTYSIPAPTPEDTTEAGKNLSDAWGAYWRTYYARAKATVCKP